MSNHIVVKMRRDQQSAQLEFPADLSNNNMLEMVRIILGTGPLTQAAIERLVDWMWKYNVRSVSLISGGERVSIRRDSLMEQLGHRRWNILEVTLEAS